MNRYGARHWHKYTKHKTCRRMMVLICIKQYLSHIWTSIHEKVKQHGKALLTKKRVISCTFRQSENVINGVSTDFPEVINTRVQHYNLFWKTLEDHLQFLYVFNRHLNIPTLKIPLKHQRPLNTIAICQGQSCSSAEL